MARIVRVKNNKASQDTWVGQVLSPGEYYDLSNNEIKVWSENQKVFNDIGSGDLIVNKGADLTDDFSDSVRGYNWLKGDVEPPRTKDGDWHVVHENFAHVNGNKNVNWTFEKFLDAGASFKERFTIPNGETFTLDAIEGGSATVPVTLRIEWMVYSNSVWHRMNPEIRVDEIWTFTADGVHSAGATEIAIAESSSNTIDETEVGKCYNFQGADGSVFMRKIDSVDTVNKTMSFAVPTTVDVLDGAKIALIDRPIGVKSTQTAATELHFASPPQFDGDGVNYIEVTIENNHQTDGGLITGVVNGWLTSTTDGD